VSKYVKTRNLSDNLTIKHILEHKSGIDATWDVNSHSRTTMDTFVKNLKGIHEPGEYYEYNNNAVEILGIVIRNITGKSVLDNSRELIFDKLGIQNISWLSDKKGNNYCSWGLSVRAGDLLTLGLALHRGEIINDEYMSMIKNDGLLFWNMKNGYRMDGYLGQILYIGDNYILVRQKKWYKGIVNDTQFNDVEYLLDFVDGKNKIIGGFANKKISCYFWQLLSILLIVILIMCIFYLASWLFLKNIPSSQSRHIN